MPRRRRRTTIEENKTHTQCKYCCVLCRSFERTRSCCNFLFGNRIKERKRTNQRASDTQYCQQKEKFVIKLRDASKRMQCSDIHDKRQECKKKVFSIYKNINKRRQSGKMAYKNYESQWKRRAEVKYELWSLKCFSVIFSLVLLLSFFIHQSCDFVMDE